MGDIAEGRAHLDRAIGLYDPREHRPLTARFGHDIRMAALGFRSWAQWILGFPEAALADAGNSVKDAREVGEAATLMFSLTSSGITNIFCGEYTAATALIDELVALAEDKGAALWKAWGIIHRGRIFAAIGQPTEAIPIITEGLSASRSTGAIKYLGPLFLSDLAWAYASLGRNDDAFASIAEAIAVLETTRQRCFEADVNIVAAEIVLRSPKADVAKAQNYLDRALDVARRQKAKSLELRAAMSIARLWRDQDKVQQARELLAPVYGWFTEGFDTRDLKEAKRLLDELA
jgi:predicted ATPase